MLDEDIAFRVKRQPSSSFVLSKLAACSKSFPEERNSREQGYENIGPMCSIGKGSRISSQRYTLYSKLELTNSFPEDHGIRQ